MKTQVEKKSIYSLQSASEGNVVSLAVFSRAYVTNGIRTILEPLQNINIGVCRWETSRIPKIPMWIGNCSTGVSNCKVKATWLRSVMSTSMATSSQTSCWSPANMSVSALKLILSLKVSLLTLSLPERPWNTKIKVPREVRAMFAACEKNSCTPYPWATDWVKGGYLRHFLEDQILTWSVVGQCQCQEDEWKMHH